MMKEMAKQLKRLLLPASVLLVANSVYLALRADPTIFYMGNVLLHIGLGFIVAVLFALWVKDSFRSLPWTGKVASVALLAGAVIGAVLTWTGAYRPYRWALHWHIGLMAVGLILIAIALYSQYISPSRRRIIVTLAVFALLLPVVLHSYARYSNSDESRISNPPLPPASMFEEGGGTDSPFFPSSGETTSGKTIPSTFFMTSDSCKRCHTDIYNQWFSSAHHFSSFNNQWYRKSIEYMQDTIGTKPSKWCGGCHDHAVLFNGMMDTPIKKIINRPEAQAGLACTSCHAIVHVKSTMGQGDFVIEYPPLHDLAANKNAYLEKLHDYLVRVDPDPHKKVFMKPFVRGSTAEFCSACHKVHLDVPVNSYRWSRGFNDYDNWQASGISGQGARSFYYPPKPQVCADCHMPLVDAKDPAAINGRVHSHRFPGANTALPYVNKDEQQLKTVESFLKTGKVTVDIFGITDAIPKKAVEVKPQTGEGPQIASTFAIGEEALTPGFAPGFLMEPAKVTAPLDRLKPTVRRGDALRVEIVVRTRKVGHFFPGGTVDAFDVWLELQAVDNKGQVIFWSGKVEDNGKGPVDPGAHFYRALLLDEHGNQINKRNAWAARSVAYVRLIPPGAADTAHFRLQIPENCGDTIYLKAKLNYRKFAWWNTHWAFAGIRAPKFKDYKPDRSYDDSKWIFAGDTSHVSGKMKQIPDLPIVEMATAEAILHVAGKGENIPALSTAFEASDRERWNDYGIGLLLQGDLKGAEQAFVKVTEIDPRYADGWVNIARARIQEGDTDGAQEVLKRALAIDPNLAKTHFFYAMTLKTKGQYQEALEHLSEVIEQYPRDRVVRNQAGRILFLQRRYNEAIEQFQKALEVDPEDLQAHYNLMLCYQGLKNVQMAEKEEKFYLRFKADEASQTITGPYRLLHAEDNNERQPIHEHQ
jgi:tetratricopeptide (TPR) repeat protein